MKKTIKLGFIDKKLERRAQFPLVASDKDAYMLELDMSKYPNAKTVIIYAKRADGEIVYDSFDIDGIKNGYILKQSIYSVPGELLLRLVLRDDEETILTAAEIRFEVLAGSCGGTVAEDCETIEGFISELRQMREYIDTSLCDIEIALDNIIEIQNALMGVSE